MNMLCLTVTFVAILFTSVQCATIVSTNYNGQGNAAARLLAQLRDNRGCDAVVNSCGNKGSCCDVHDACYRQYGCTAASWLYLYGDCVGCNNAVMACVAFRNPGKSSCCTRGDCGQPWK